MSANSRGITIAAVLLCVGVVVMVSWNQNKPDIPLSVEAPQEEERKVAELELPPHGFDEMLQVLDSGGTSLELGAAIEYLDTLARTGEILTSGYRDKVLASMERGSPADMGEGPWSHIFNSACNALEVGQVEADERLVIMLESIAIDDSRLVMRLYALQHLGKQYDRASPVIQKRLRSLVQSLLDEPEAQTAGTALVLWREWEHSAEPDSVSSLELSRAIVADRSRPLDVRVTALHVMGEEASVLDMARSIAADSTQPIILRKSALHLIGQHGSAQDLLVLQGCVKESPRLAQAAKPATRSLEGRLAGKPKVSPNPY